MNIDIFNLPNYFTNFFDIVLEYTCFCAIDPNQRTNYVKVVKHILKSNGLFVGILFPLNDDKSRTGPPFHIDLDKTLTLFDSYMIKQECTKHQMSVRERIDREMFIIYKKNGN
jgi:hypothetical protein